MQTTLPNPRRNARSSAARETMILALYWIALVLCDFSCSKIYAAVRVEPDVNATKRASLWITLGDNPGMTVDAAIAKLAETPIETMAMIEHELAPLLDISDAGIADLISKLDSTGFDDRENATNQLSALSLLVEPQLRRAHKTNLSPEAKLRVQSLLDRMPRTFATTPAQRRLVRVSQLLDKIDTPRAKVIRRMLDPAVDLLVVDEKIPPLYAQLNSSSDEERVKAAIRLCEMGHLLAPVTTRMTEMLTDQTMVQIDNQGRPVRGWIIESLRHVRPKVSNEMLTALGHQDPLIRAGAVEILGYMPEPLAAARLIELMADKEYEVVSQASQALTRLGESSVEPLIKSLANPDAPTRSRVANVCGTLRHTSLVQPLARLLGDEDRTVRECAAHSLTKLAQEDSLGTIWRPSDAIEDKEAAARSRAENDAALRKLVVAALDTAIRGDNPTARLASLECARSVRAPELRGAIIQCLSTDDAALRHKAILALYADDSAEILPPLLRALRDPNADVLAAAAGGLRMGVHRFSDSEHLVAPLIVAMQEDDRRVRLNAVQTLLYVTARNKQSAVPQLIKLLQETDEEVAGAAVESLANLGDKRAADPLFALLGKTELRAKASLALARLGDARALPSLREHLAAADRDTIVALGVLKDRESVERLIAILQDPKEQQQLRTHAAEALGNIRDVRAVEPLIAMLAGDEQLQRHAARALGEIGDPRAVAALIDSYRHRKARFNRFPQFGVEDESDHDSLFWPLIDIGPPAIEPLARALADSDISVRKMAAVTLYNLSSPGRHGLDSDDFQPAVEQLADAINDSSEVVRNYAALSLAGMKDPRCYDRLVEMIATTTPQSSPIYRNAASCLSTIRDEKSLARVADLLQHEQPLVRAAAAGILGWSREQRFVQPLIAALTDKDAAVRAEVVAALGNLKSPEALSQFVKLLSSAEEPLSVRCAAAKAIGRIDDAAGKESLVAAVVGNEFDLRVAASMALIQLNDQRGVEPLGRCLADENVKRREAVLSKISVASPASKLLEPLLIKALNDHSNRVRYSAAENLGRIESTAAVDALLARLSDRDILRAVLSGLGQTRDERALEAVMRYWDDTDPKIRQAVAGLLSKHDSERCIDQLIQHLADPSPDVRLTIVKSLSTLKSKKAVEPLKKALNDEDPQVRIFAARALRRIGS